MVARDRTIQMVRIKVTSAENCFLNNKKRLITSAGRPPVSFIRKEIAKIKPVRTYFCGFSVVRKR